MESHPDVPDHRHTAGNNAPAQLSWMEIQRQQGRQKLEEAKNARENATAEHLQQLGIVLSDDDFAPEEDEGPARKKIRIDNRDDIHKVFNHGIGPDIHLNIGDTMDLDTAEEEFDETRIESAAAKTQGLGIKPRILEIHETYLRRQQQAISEFEALITPIFAPNLAPYKSSFDLLGSISTSADLAVEVCKNLRPTDIVNLYSISRDFHTVLDAFMHSCVTVLAKHMAPTAAAVCKPSVYTSLCIDDPAGRPRDPAYYDMAHLTLGTQQPVVVDTEARRVPSLKWLSMVYTREKYTRDIVATMARMGHRLARNSREMLLKLWLLMDIATSEGRLRVVRNTKLFSDQILYDAQLFLVKLLLLFNNPVYGPDSPKLMYLFLGQRGLAPLWALLRRKKYNTEREIVEAALRYDVDPTLDLMETGLPIYGVPIHEIGTGHLEGWGGGDGHLLRPDELIPIESVRRNLDIDEHIDFFLHFGHVDYMTGRNLVPSLEELYMSDDEYPWPDPDFDKSIDGGCGNVPFEPNMWLPRQARKARWGTLTNSQRKEILQREKIDMQEETMPQFVEVSKDEEVVEVDLEKQKYEQRLAEYKTKAAVESWKVHNNNDQDTAADDSSDDSSQENAEGAREDAMDLDDDHLNIPRLRARAPASSALSNVIPLAPTLHRLRERNFTPPDSQGSSLPGAKSAPGSRVTSVVPPGQGPQSISAQVPGSYFAQTSGLFVPDLADTAPSLAISSVDRPPPPNSSRSGPSATPNNNMLREAAESLAKGIEVDETATDISAESSEASSDRESEKGWRDEDVDIPALTEAQRDALDAEADQEYEDDDINYPWEIVVRSCKLIEKMPLTQHELRVMGWLNDGVGKRREGKSHQPDSEYKEDDEEKDPRLANPTQIVLQKEGEMEGEEKMSDVGRDDEGLVIHQDGEEDDEDWDNDYDPSDYLWDPEITGKHGFLRNFYRRY